MTAAAERKRLPPRLPRKLPDEVVRTRLFDLLDEGVEARALTLVSAPPGAGKTILLSSWLRERPPSAPVVWLALHDGDDASLWPPVLRTIGGLCGHETDSVGLVENLVDLLDDLADPLVLVVDDLHNAAPAALASLDRLLHAPPAKLRIVAASRFDPPLALHVLRLTGDLAELRATDLAFDGRETRELFDHLDLDVAPWELAALLERTEGWAAGLRLFAISLLGTPNRESAFDRLWLDERPIAEYLAAEVLATQTPEIRAFLLRTSIVPALDAELANALTGRTDAERMLDRLCRANLFLERLSGEPATYRYHQLFRALLLAEARYELGDQLGELHEQAARLLAQRGRPLSALQHAAGGGSWGLVSTLLADHWAGAIAAAPGRTSRDLIASIPPEQVVASPVVGAFSALLRLVAGDARRASALLAAAGRGREQVPPAARDAFDSLLRYASALAARAGASFTRALELATIQIERAPVEAVSAVDEDRRRTLGLVTVGVSQLWLGATADAEDALEEAIALARTTGDVLAEADALAHLALVDLSQGRFRRAARFARASLTLDEEALPTARPAMLAARTALAFAHHVWGDDVAARESLAAAQTAARSTGDVPGRALVAIAAARLAASSGGDDADDALLQLRAMRARSPAAKCALVSGYATALEARLLAETGRLDEAHTILAEPGNDPETVVAAARIELARGVPAAALLGLAGLRAPSHATRIEALVTEAVAHHTLGDAASAHETLARALVLAEPEVVTRPFLDAGLPIRELLGEHLRTTNTQRWLASELVGALDGRVGRGRTAPAELLEPLSQREREVLRYLPTIMSNADIAAELFVSVNTVKTHVKSIYRKLGANRRQDAVRCARQLRLL